MSFSLATLRTQTRRYVNELDSANSNFEDSEIDDYLNQALLFLGTQMEWSILTTQTPCTAGQGLYALPSDFISLSDAYFNGSKIITLEREDLGGISPSWQQDQPSTPKIIYRNDFKSFGLYPVPDITQDQFIIQIQYIQMPASMALDADIPNIHTAFQLCLPFYAAFICQHRLGNQKKSDINLQKYDEHRRALMSKVQRFSDDNLRFRWSWNYPESSGNSVGLGGR